VNPVGFSYSSSVRGFWAIAVLLLAGATAGCGAIEGLGSFSEGPCTGGCDASADATEEGVDGGGGDVTSGDVMLGADSPVDGNVDASDANVPDVGGDVVSTCGATCRGCCKGDVCVPFASESSASCGAAGTGVRHEHRKMCVRRDLVPDGVLQRPGVRSAVLTVADALRRGRRHVRRLRTGRHVHGGCVLVRGNDFVRRLLQRFDLRGLGERVEHVVRHGWRRVRGVRCQSGVQRRTVPM
jgi:hypothetical protein